MQLSGDEFKAVERELVFDIDMDDYDEFRSCCTDKRICNKCWRFISIAVELITLTLKEDFGYKDILWVYSGRRGIHCWVCDDNARKLPSDGRSSIIDYLNLITYGDGHNKKVNLYNHDLHPLIIRAFKICYSNFYKLLKEQNFFNNKIHLNTLLEYFPEKLQNARKIILNTINNNINIKDSNIFFNQICQALNIDTPQSFKPNNFDNTTQHIPTLFIEAIIAFSYPRLDINVSKDIAHLLKSPFCVHAKTGILTLFLKNLSPNRHPSKSNPTLLHLVFVLQTALHLRSSHSPWWPPYLLPLPAPRDRLQVLHLRLHHHYLHFRHDLWEWLYSLEIGNWKSHHGSGKESWIGPQVESCLQDEDKVVTSVGMTS